jgi:predicted dehydrogenase
MIGDVKEVFAVIRNFNHKGIIEFEDTGCVSLQFHNGAIGTLHYTVNSYEKNMEGSLTIFGEKGTVKIGGQYLNVLEYQQIEGLTIENVSIGRPANNYGSYQGSMSNHEFVYKEVINVLQNGGTITNAADAMKTVEIIERIYGAAIK